MTVHSFTLPSSDVQSIESAIRAAHPCAEVSYIDGKLTVNCSRDKPKDVFQQIIDEKKV